MTKTAGTRTQHLLFPASRPGACNDLSHAEAGLCYPEQGKATQQGSRRQDLLSKLLKILVAFTQLALIKNRACVPHCPAVRLRSEALPSKPGLLSYLSACVFVSFAIDSYGLFLRAPLEPIWQGAAPSSLLLGVPTFPGGQPVASCCFVASARLPELAVVQTQGPNLFSLCPPAPGV